MKKRTLPLIIVLVIVISLFNGYEVKAGKAVDDTLTYKVEQVTDLSEVNSNNLYKYILVTDFDGGQKIALASSLSSSGYYYMSSENYVEAEITGNTLTVQVDSPNILWQFTKSMKSVLEDGDNPVIASVEEVYPGRTHLKLSSGGSGGATGIRYSGNGNGFHFEEVDDDYFILSENNCETSNRYLGFNRHFCKAKEDGAARIQIYRVIEEYNYSSSKFLTSEETAALDEVKINKTVSPYEDYDDTAIAEVKLSTNGIEYDKTCDIVLMLDDSTSVYTAISSDSDKTRAQVIREDAYIFAERILEINPENRINVIKFGKEITNEDASDYYGFTNDIDEIEEMIGGDKAAVTYGTDYSLAFKKANEMMEHYSDPKHGKLVIFLSDGMPTIYNGISATTFMNSGDSEGYATNWVDYVTNTPLQEAELMKATGTTIYTIGSIEDDVSMNNSDSFIIPAGTTKTVLSNISNGRTNFYDFDKIDTQLDDIFEIIAKDFNYYPTNAVVEDYLSTDINLLTKDVQTYIPEIVFKRDDVEIERITFNSDGTEAYTSLNPGTNILDGNQFEGMYVSFDGNKIKWNIGDLYKYEYTLEFPIYLNKTVNTYGDGNSRPTGEYSVSDSTILTFIDMTGEEKIKEFESATLSWKNPTDESSITDEQPENPVIETATNVKTGDNVVLVVGALMLTILAINIYKKKLSKFGRKNKTVIF